MRCVTGEQATVAAVARHVRDRQVAGATWRRVMTAGILGRETFPSTASISTDVRDDSEGRNM
jgi:hypothetical protein